MLRYSVYYKAKNNMYHNNYTSATFLETLDKDIANSFLKDASRTAGLTINSIDDDIIDILYPDICNPYNMRYELNAYDNNNSLRVINNIIKFFEQLQLRFNYVSLDKCGSPILLKKYFNNNELTNEDINDKIYNNNCNLTTVNQLSDKTSHDLYVYLHNFTKESQILRLFKLAVKIQKYIHSNYKYRNCCVNPSLI